MKTKKMTNILTSTMLASTLIFSVGAGSAFANEGTESTEENVNIELVTETSTEDGQVTEGTDLTDGEVTDEVLTGEEATEEEVTGEEIDLADTDTEVEEDVKAPSLVPGDFFYFAKKMLEKVRLAFTFNDYEEARLLAEFTAERIAEANALIAEGKTEEAEELLREAIATQGLASEELPDSEEVTEDTDTDTEVTPEGETTEEATTEEEAVEGEETVETTVEKKLAHNIDALLAVLAKIENPRAQQAIMKNIQKSFAKLEKKAARLEAKDAKLAEKMEDLEEQISPDPVVEDEVEGKKDKKQKDKRDKNKETVVVEEETDVVVEETPATTETTTIEQPSKQVNKGQQKKAEALEKTVEKKNAGAAKTEEKKNNAGNNGNGKGNQGQENKGNGNKGQGNNGEGKGK